MHKELNLIAILFALVGTYLCIAAFFTANTENSLARFNLTVDQTYASSTNAFVMALVVWVGSWYNYSVLPTIKWANSIKVDKLEKSTKNNVSIESTENNCDNNFDSKEKIKKTANKKEYMKEYRKNNMNKWTELKVCIECGNTYGSSNSGNHLKSKKHEYGRLAKENTELQKKIQNFSK